jgi:hypothetical protein
MRRRDFITLLGGAATWPVAARAQKPEQMRPVSVLVGLDEKDAEAQRRAKAFRLGMRDLGWIEGRNVQKFGLPRAILSQSISMWPR